jgi:hypothetical protein
MGENLKRPGGGYAGPLKVDQLSGVINFKTKPSLAKKQLTRRQAFLRRQELVRERAAKKAEKAAVDKKSKSQAVTLKLPDLGITKNPDFARAIRRAESDKSWNGNARLSWRQLAQPSRGFAPGGRCWHQKFGSGVVLEVDGEVLTIWFDAVGQKRIIDSFVESD